jgi:hypothetical protein
VSWVTVSPASGSGTGTVTFTVAANTTTAARSATLAIAGQAFAITQNAAVCTYTLGGTVLRVGSAGGSVVVSVTCLSDCGWSAVSNVSWVSVAPAISTGPGSVQVTVAANSGTSPRTGSVTVAGIAVTVSQDAKAGPQAPRGLKIVGKKK